MNSINSGGDAKIDETHADTAIAASVAQLRVQRVRSLDDTRDGRILSESPRVQQKLFCNRSRRQNKINEAVRTILLSVEETVSERVQETACETRQTKDQMRE